MLAVVALLQVSLAAPPSLDDARRALHAADTATAVSALSTLVTPDSTFTGEEITALLVLRWIAHSPGWDRAKALWEQKLQRVRFSPGANWTLQTMLMFVLQQLAEGRSDAEVIAGLSLPGLAPYKQLPWATRLRELAESAGEDPLTTSAARLVAAQGWLDHLHEFAKAVPTVSVPLACQHGCLLLRSPPADVPLLARLRAPDTTVAGADTVVVVADRGTERIIILRVGRKAAFDSLWVSLADLRSSPWPFNEFGERLRVTVCALLHLGAESESCAPRTQDLDTVVAAELRAVRYAFEGHAGLADRAMAVAPARFAALDQSVDLLLADSVVVWRTVPMAASDVSTRFRVPSPRAPPPPAFWRAAWPLYLQPYNERLIVHRARLLLADMSRRLAPGPGDSTVFGPYGNPETLVRVGVPLALARAPGPPAARFPLVIYAPRGTHETIVREGEGMAGVSLDLALAARNENAPTTISGFAAEDYDSFRAMDHQVIRYRRSREPRVEVYTRWVPPLNCLSPLPTLGFFLLDSTLQQLSRAVDVDPMKPPRTKRYYLELAPGSYVYSLEMLDRSCRVAQRGRYVLTVPRVDDQPISDLMLADELYFGDERWVARIKDRPPVTVRPSLRLAAGTVARFYWELYGVTAEEMQAGRLKVTFEVVNVEREHVPVWELSRVAEQARKRAGTLDVKYELALPSGDGPLGFGLAVGIPDGTQGVHVARVRVTDTKTKRTVTTERAFFVRG